MPYAGTRSTGSTSRFAVGNPSVPPRWSPATTTPSTSGGRPSAAAARPTSPAWSSCRTCDEETPSTSGTARTSNPSRSSRARSPRRARPNRKPFPAAEDPLRELLWLEAGDVERELDDEPLVDSELGNQLEPPVERGEQLDPVP